MPQKVPPVGQNIVAKCLDNFKFQRKNSFCKNTVSKINPTSICAHAFLQNVAYVVWKTRNFVRNNGQNARCKNYFRISKQTSFLRRHLVTHNKKKQPRGCLFQKIFQLVNNLLVVLVLLAWFDKVFRATFFVAMAWYQLHVEVIHWPVAHCAKVHAWAVVHLLQRLHAFLRKHKGLHAQFRWNFRHVFEVLFATYCHVTVGSWVANKEAFQQVVFKNNLFGNVAVQAVVVLLVVASGANACIYKLLDSWLLHFVLLCVFLPRGWFFAIIKRDMA